MTAIVIWVVASVVFAVGFGAWMNRSDDDV